MSIVKVLQRHVLDVLNCNLSRPNIWRLFGVIFFVLPCYTFFLYFLLSTDRIRHLSLFSTGRRCLQGNDNIGRNIYFEEELHCSGAIDAVYTWVNGSDPVWLAKKHQYQIFRDHHQHHQAGNNTEQALLERKLSSLGNQLKTTYGAISQLRDDGNKSGLKDLDNIFKTHSKGNEESADKKKNARIQKETTEFINDDEVRNTRELKTNASDDTEIKTQAFNISNGSVVKTITNQTTKVDDQSDALGDHRYRDNNELKYSLRSLEKYAPWIRHVYLVTDNQIPSWLNLKSEKLTLISHGELFENKSHLPTFSSPSIESNLHRIPGLSSKFLYFNDDVMLGAPVYPSDFYTASGGQKIYLSWDVPTCNEGCMTNWLGDGYCDSACNVTECDFDNGDCVGSNANKFSYDNTYSYSSNEIYGKSMRYCAPGCPSEWLGDNVCDEACNTIDCAFDALDCQNPSGDNAFLKFPIFIINNVLVSKDNYSASLIELPFGTRAVVINLTDTLNMTLSSISPSIFDMDSKIDLTASYSESDIVAQVILRTDVKLLIVVFLNKPREEDNSNLYSNTYAGNTYGTLEDECKPDKSIGKDPHPDFDPILWGGLNEADYARDWAICFSTAVNDTYIPGCDSVIGCEIFDDLDQALQRCAIRGDRCTGVTESYNGEFSTRSGTRLSNSKLVEASWIKLKPESHDWSQIDAQKEWSYRIGYRNSSKYVSTIFSYCGFPMNDHKNESFKTLPNTPRPKARRIISISVNLRVHVGISKIMDHNIDLKLTAGLQMRTVASNIFTRDEEHNSRFLHSEEIYGEANTESFHSFHVRRLKQYFMALYNGYKSLLRKTESHAARQDKKSFHIVSGLYNEDEEAAKYRSVASGSEISAGQGRKLLDTFGASLKFVNHLYNKKFGSLNRKVPAHMPHLIDIDQMKALQLEFQQEFEKTSSSRFRSRNDMQFSFSYMYWIIHQGARPDLGLRDYFFQELDTNGDGSLDSNELRTLASIMSDGNNVREQFEEILMCLHVSHDDLQVVSHAKMDWLSFLNCSKATKAVLENSRRKRTFEIISEETASELISFEMITDNFTTTLHKLDSIRKKKPKFICVNDDMKTAPPRTKQALHQFYDALFPNPSQFELEPGYRNLFLYYDDYVMYINDLNSQQFYMKLTLGIIFTVAVLISIYY